MNRNSNDRLPIMIVEDSEEDFDVLKMTLDQFNIANEVIRVSHGGSVLPTLEERSAEMLEPPGLIILDLNLIGVDGREVLRRLKKNPLFSSIPVLVLSTSASPRDIATSYAEGAASYSVKPVNLEKLERFVLALKTFWLEHTILPRHASLLNYGTRND